MKAIKFKLSGKTAMFKKPDINSNVYLTYSCIHKVAVLGILGAILGLKGYNKQGNDDYPEFYSKLSNYRIGIEILNDRGVIRKSIQKFNNSTGLASKETGGNLIVNEYWLTDPEFLITIALEGNEFDSEIEDRIMNNKFHYIPYLGKNDHFANVTESELVELEEFKSDEYIKIMNIVPEIYIEKQDIVLYSEHESKNNNRYTWKYIEYLPYKLEKDTNMYKQQKFIQSNYYNKIKDKFRNSIFKYKEKIICLF